MERRDKNMANQNQRKQSRTKPMTTTKHRYTAFIDEDLFTDMKHVKALTGYSINRLLNRSARRTVDEIANELEHYQRQRERVRNTRTHV